MSDDILTTELTSAIADAEAGEIDKAMEEVQPSQPETLDMSRDEKIEYTRGLLEDEGLVPETDSNPLDNGPAEHQMSPEEYQLQGAAGQLQMAEQDWQNRADGLMGYMNSQEFEYLKQTNPGQAALQMQEAGKIQADLQQERAYMEEQARHVYGQSQANNIQAARDAVPGWHDDNVAAKEGNAMLDHFAKQGYGREQMRQAVMANPQAARTIWDRWQSERFQPVQRAAGKSSLRNAAVGPGKMNSMDRAFEIAQKKHPGHGASNAAAVAADVMKMLNVQL